MKTLDLHRPVWKEACPQEPLYETVSTETPGHYPSLSLSLSLSLPHRTRAQNSPTVVLVNENCFEERKNVLEVINRWYDLIRHRILNNRLMRIIHLQASKQASAHAHSFLPFLDNNKSVLESESKL